MVIINKITTKYGNFLVFRINRYSIDTLHVIILKSIYSNKLLIGDTSIFLIVGTNMAVDKNTKTVIL